MYLRVCCCSQAFAGNVLLPLLGPLIPMAICCSCAKAHVVSKISVYLFFFKLLLLYWNVAHEPCDSFRCTAKGLSHTSCPKVFLPAWLPRSTEQSSLCLVVGQDPGHLDGTSSGRPCQPQPRFHFPGSSLGAFSLIYLFFIIKFSSLLFSSFCLCWVFIAVRDKEQVHNWGEFFFFS